MRIHPRFGLPRDNLLPDIKACTALTPEPQVKGAVFADDDRAEEIETGAKLTENELSAAKEYVLEQQELGDGGLICSGFDIDLPDGASLFASFVGQEQGQSGIAYEFDGLFTSKQAAESAYKKMGDHWLDL